MTSTAFIFPGQGSQAVGMGTELKGAYAIARETFEEIDDALGQSLSRLMQDGPADELQLTENAQPALMAVSLAAARVLENLSGKKLSQLGRFVAGHSLGEYSALCAAGALSLKDTARLLKRRGQAMQKAVPVGVGAMAALLGVDLNAAQEIAIAAAEKEIIAAANDNAPGQVVLSGHAAAVDRAINIATERGFKRSVKLPVSAPFHCPLMKPAADEMQKALAGITIAPPSLPLIANVTAAPVTDPEAIRRLLVEQVTGLVRWRESIEYLLGQGTTQFVEIGAGSVLSGLVKRIAKEQGKEVLSLSLQKPDDIENFLKAAG